VTPHSAPQIFDTLLSDLQGGQPAMRLPKFSYLEPASLEEALTLLSEHPQTVKKAGGTDLLPRLKWRLIKPKYLMNLRVLPDLDFIRINDEGDLSIGALTPLHKIECSPIVRQHFPALAEGISQIASVEIRTIGTLGGNICLDTRCHFYNQSPLFRKGTPPCFKTGGSVCYVSRKGGRCHALFCADTVPLLVATGARLGILSSNGHKWVGIGEFYTGDGQSPFALSGDQVVAEVRIPKGVRERHGTYLKYRFRGGMDFPVVGAAVFGIHGKRNDPSKETRIVVGGATSGPVRLTEAEAVLKKGEVTNRILEKAGQAAAKEISIVSTSGCSVSYRKTLVKQLVIRALQKVLG
jgi:4-hydroxybenzoyl-CoA reductase subunit beta